MQREVDTNREIENRDRELMEETIGQLKLKTRALEDAFATAHSELDHMGAVGKENGVTQNRSEQLEREITEAKSREAKKEEEMLAKLAEAAEAIEDTKQQARGALHQAESRWQDILAKRDAKRIEELQAKEVEKRELLEVAEERLREIAMLQQEVSDLQEGVSEMVWMKERMAGFEREVILEVSDLSRALEEKEEVIDGLQTALKSARDALVEAEANLRREEKHNRGAAAAKVRDFAAELSEVEDLYRLELQRKEGQMRSLEAELHAARDGTAEQAEAAERIQGELAKERERNEERMARVAGEIDGLRARVAGAESAGKIAAALRSELEACRLECDSLRERYTTQQLENVELGQQVVASQRQLEVERGVSAFLEADLRNSIKSVEAELRQAQSPKQGLESELGGVVEELGGGEGPVNLLAAVRTLRERADESRRALSDALSQVELLKGMEEQVAAKSERMKELRRALSDAKEALGELQAKREVEGQGLAEQVSKVLEQARQEREAWTEAERVNADRFEELKNCEDRAKRALSECQQELRAEQALRKAAEERNAEIGAELHKVVSTVEQKDGELDKLGSQVSDLQRRVEEEKQKQVAAQTVIDGLKGQVLNLESQLATSDTQKQEASEKVVSLEGQLREKSEGLSKLADSLKVLEGQSAEKRAAVDLVEALRNDLTEVTSQLERAKEQLKGREGELRTALRERDEKEEEAVRIAQELRAEREKGEKQSEGMKRHVEV
jgi:chromosome segregation ATPase